MVDFNTGDIVCRKREPQHAHVVRSVGNSCLYLDDGSHSPIEDFDMVEKFNPALPEALSEIRPGDTVQVLNVAPFRVVASVSGTTLHFMDGSWGPRNCYARVPEPPSAEPTYARRGAPWTPAEDAWLAEQFKAGEPLARLTAAHQRSEGAVVSRLKHLKLLRQDYATGWYYPADVEPWCKGVACKNKEAA